MHFSLERDLLWETLPPLPSGKTVQAISFVASVFAETGASPHLLVVPLSTLRNWEREFATWAPHLNVVSYTGSQPSRHVCRQYELFFAGAMPKDRKGKGSGTQNRQARIQVRRRSSLKGLMASHEGPLSTSGWGDNDPGVPPLFRVGVILYGRGGGSPHA